MWERMGGGGGYLGHFEDLPDQVLLAVHSSSHNSVGRDAGQVALLKLIHWLAGVVRTEQLKLVPVRLLWQNL